MISPITARVTRVHNDPRHYGETIFIPSVIGSLSRFSPRSKSDIPLFSIVNPEDIRTAR